MNSITGSGRRLANILASIAAAAACVSTPAHADDAAMQAAATSTRTQWNVMVGRARDQQAGMIAPKAATPPVINSVSIAAGTNANVTNFPKPVRVNLNVSSVAGVRSILIDVRSRDFAQGHRREVVLPYLHKTGVIGVETLPFVSHNMPGNYDVRFVGVCDILGQCTEQDFYGTDPVAGRAFALTNSRPPDLSKPSIYSAALNTATLTTHSTGEALVNLALGIDDTVTGAVGVSVCARPASEAYEVCGYWDLPSAMKHGVQKVTIPFEGNSHETGTWHIAVVEIVDRVGNQLFQIDPTALDTMFPGGRTFTLSNGS